jgi:hypothetical protein
MDKLVLLISSSRAVVNSCLMMMLKDMRRRSGSDIRDLSKRVLRRFCSFNRKLSTIGPK